MTTKLAPKAALTPVQALIAQGLTADQIRAIAAALDQLIQTRPELDELLSAYDDRLRQNGLTPDMAVWWAQRVAAAWETSGEDMAHELISSRLVAASSHGLTRAEAWSLADFVTGLRNSRDTSRTDATEAAIAPDESNVVEGSIVG